MPPKRDAATADLQDLRLRSRQDYLAKREETQVQLLRQKILDNEEEERTNPRLSKAERDEFARDKELLSLILSRNAIDDTGGGFIIPDADFSDKAELLNRKHKENYVSEVQQWENEQTSKAKAQIKRSGRVQEDEYDLVFDESQAPQWINDAASRIEPDRAQLQQMLDAAEQKVKTIEEVKKSLPVWQFKDQIIDAVGKHPQLVLIGETGSGKSTQLPQFLRDAGYCRPNENGKPMVIGITQPRRVAAMSVAKRVADEVGCRLGNEVGYSIRFENRCNEKTVIKYLTDGMLLREMMADPSLESYSVVVLDEAHERSINTDVLMPLLKDISRLRPDFRLVISSATVESDRFSKYFDDCPIFNVPGRRFPVDIHYTQAPEANYLAACVSTAMQIHVSQPVEGNSGVLIFLTGEEECEAASNYLDETARKLRGRIKELMICPIYAALDTQLQAKAFTRPPPSARKIVIATNIAETSITIDDIGYVIDPGFTKQTSYNPTTNLQSLSVVPCSRASADQRAGRAGRTGPGKCFRVYTKHSYYQELPSTTPPEILRSKLDGLVLNLKSLGVNDLVGFDFMDSPAAETLIRSIENVYALGGFDGQGVVTRVGRQMSELPLDPTLSKAIIAADKYGCVDEVLTIAAMVQESAALFLRPSDPQKRLYADAARKRMTHESGDLITYLNIYQEWEAADFSAIWAKDTWLQQRCLTRARDVKEQLEKLCDRISVERSSAGSDYVSIQKAITAGFFGNACRLNRDGMSYRTLRGGMQVYIHPSSSLSQLDTKRKLILYYELVQTSKEYARSCMSIESEWLIDAAPHVYKREDVDKLGLDKKMPRGPGKVGNGAPTPVTNRNVSVR